MGLIVGLPALRLKGDYLAIVTLGCGEIIKSIITNLNVTGGAKGLNTGAIYADTKTLLPYGIVLVFLVVIVMMNLKNSRHGRAIMAIRDNRIAAESNGVNVTYYKLMVFIIAAFFAGMAGVLYGHTLANIKPAMFDYNMSIEILVIVVLGGMGSIRGSIIATIILRALPEALREVADYRMLAYSVLLIVIMLLNASPKFAELKGRTILSTGKGTTPEYVLRYLLTKNGLDPDKDVKIEYYSEASEVTAQMAASKKDAIAVLPQPYVTAAQLKDSSLRVVLDLTKEWNKVCDTQLITGVTVVRTEYAKENPDIVANFLRDYEKSIKAAQTDVAGTAALCEETGVVAKKAIAQKALPRCNIVYRVGDEMKADVNAYLKVLYDASHAAVGGKLPDANFYYTKATPGQVFWKSVQRSFQ